MNRDEIVKENKTYTLASWRTQGDWDPLLVTHAEGVYFYDSEGKKYLDWASQVVNVNLGHGNPEVIQAIKDQADKLCYISPSTATEVRGNLGRLLSEITPPHLNKSLFTTGGADAVENAIKIARLFTGKRKIITRYRSYHGATAGAMTAGGDPRRLANEPGIDGIVRFHCSDPYRNPMYTNRTEAEGDAISADLLERTILMEGPEYIAAILLEGYSGSSGIFQPSEIFWNSVQQLCDKYGILLIIDEVMSGFGRTGKWFGFNHYPNLKPDIVCMAKGITSGYIPLGAVLVSDEIAAYFDKHTLWSGLTYSAHTLACAAGVAVLSVYHEYNLIENAKLMGGLLKSELEKLKEKHPCIGDIRGTGLLQVIDLVKNRGSKEPLSPFNGPSTEPMLKVTAKLKSLGLTSFIRWNWIFCAPPLIITEEQLMTGINIIDEALSIADKYVKE